MRLDAAQPKYFRTSAVVSHPFPELRHVYCVYYREVWTRTQVIFGTDNIILTHGPLSN